MPSIVPVTVNSPAKLNLSLRLLHRRQQDVYTELHSVVALLQWYDFLTFTPHFQSEMQGESQSAVPAIQFVCSNVALAAEAPTSNLVYRAIALFYQSVPVAVLPLQARPYQWHVLLQKNIPFQAGLGGGSSNAASTLRFLNQWHATHQEITCFSLEALQVLGAMLGSDVPLFLTPEEVSLVCMTGRGEHIIPLPLQATNSLKGVYCVVIKPNTVAVSTALAFNLLHQQQCYSKVTPAEQTMWLAALQTGTPLWQLTPHLVNEFEPLIWQLEPSLQHLMQQLQALGAFHTLLCGSGSAVAGLFVNTELPVLQATVQQAFSCTVYTYQIVPFVGCY